MENILLHFTMVFMGFFAIMNPIANIPIFLGLVEGDSEKTIKTIAFQSLITAFLIISTFAIVGKLLFELFGITLSSFRITGGILVFIIGFHMLQGKHSSANHLTEKENQQCLEDSLSVAISPLATPILAGPGSIATAMNFSARGGIVNVGITILAFALLSIITYILFIFSEKLVTIIGTGILGVITRMMGLIIAVMGTQMIIEGLRDAFKLVV